MNQAERYLQLLGRTNAFKTIGKVQQVIGLTIEATGLKAPLGSICHIFSPLNSQSVAAEVVGFRENRALLMPLGELDGIAPGCQVAAGGESFRIAVGEQLLGKILNGLGQPLKGEPIMPRKKFKTVSALPSNPLKRKRINKVLATGIKAVDGLLTCGQGQRLGIFSGSGVGKSTLLGMIARHSTADVNVIALIGERGREVLEFLERDLGTEGLRRSVVVVATSDQPALVRIKGAFVATAVAEYFRDQGKSVLLIMDSLTRFAMAQREVGLAVGEPPSSRGYTPSVFAVLPRLLERSGNWLKGSITGMYAVLVDADDLNEPISDAVRGILDGHIVLSRELAARGHYPAIDILNSISRLFPDLALEGQQKLSQKIRDLLSTYYKSEDLINIGAYNKGTNPRIDEAVFYYSRITAFLCQGAHEHYSFTETQNQLEEVFKTDSSEVIADG